MTSGIDGLFSPTVRAELEAELPSYLAPRRWFRSKTRAIDSVSIARVFPLAGPGDGIALMLVRVFYREGAGEDYALVVESTRDESAVAGARPGLVIGKLQGDGAEPMWLLDGLGSRRALVTLMGFLARGGSVKGWSSDGGTALLSARTFGPIQGIEAPKPVETEQSNTSVVFGDKSILKVIRRPDDGPSPELEMSEYLTVHGFPGTPPLLAALELDRGSAEPATLAVVYAFVPNEGDAWTFALRALRAGGAAPETAFVRRVGERVAAMHAVLSAPTGDPRFAVEPLGRQERRTLAEAVERSLSLARAKAAGQTAALAAGVQARLEAALGGGRIFRRVVAALLDVDPCWKSRVHGNLHLGQLLVRGDDFIVIDFEGEPARSLEDRRAKRSPMVDVAGMLRSLHYASVTAGVGPTWFAEARKAFLDGYGAPAGALPERASDREALLRFFSLEKCVYELHYELDNRPDWVETPLEGLEELMRDTDAG